jgi:hypothetical protein
VADLPRIQAFALPAAALAVLALAAPRLTASLWELRPAAYLDSLSAKVALTGQQLNVIKPELQQALAVIETAHGFESLAMVNLRLARLADMPQERRTVLLEEAKRAIRSGLAYGCGNPYAWLNLALIEKQLGKEPKAVIDAVAMSILTGRADAGLYLDRLDLALNFYSAADDEAKSLIAQQLRLAWKHRRKEILKLVMAYKKEAVLSAALSYSSAEH